MPYQWYRKDLVSEKQGPVIDQMTGPEASCGPLMDPVD